MSCERTRYITTSVKANLFSDTSDGIYMQRIQQLTITVVPHHLASAVIVPDARPFD